MEVSAGWPGGELDRHHVRAAAPVDRSLDERPFLREFQQKEVGTSYPAARLLAAKETGIALAAFPEQCPFTPQQVLDLEYYRQDRETE